MSDMWDASPRSVMRASRRWSGIALLALILLAALITGGWQAGWWFTSQNANRQAHLIRNGYSNQQTLREEITKQIANVNALTVSVAQSQGNQAEVAALDSQRIAVVNIACQQADQVTGDPLAAGQQAWVTQNCQAGSIRPGSPYDTTGGTQ